MRKLIGVVISIFIVSFSNMAYSTDQIDFFKPSISKNNGSLNYEINKLGGYKFSLDKKWINTTAQSALDKFNAIVFLRNDDETQSLTFTVGITPDAEKGNPINVKYLIEKSLTKKNIKYSVVSSKIYKIDDKDVEEIDVSLGNNRMMYVVGMFYKNLTVTGNLGYKADDPSTKKDLVWIFESFQTY